MNRNETSARQAVALVREFDRLVGKRSAEVRRMVWSLLSVVRGPDEKVGRAGNKDKFTWPLRQKLVPKITIAGRNDMTYLRRISKGVNKNMAYTDHYLGHIRSAVMVLKEAGVRFVSV